MYLAGFQCLACSRVQPAEFAGYVCPACGGNLDATYDYDALRGLITDHKLLAPGRDDIFRYANLLPVRDLAHAPRLRVGNTPIYPAPRLGAAAGLRNLYVKDDGLNPSGSFKDRASAVAITRAIESGAKVVAGASTGNAGCSMACMAASLGVPCVIFVPEKAPPAKIAQLLIFGARVLAVRGTYDDAFDLCMKVCERTGWFNRNTGFNPYTREGKKTGAYELCEQLSWVAPDRVVVAVGDGNILSGIWKGMRDLVALDLIEKMPKIDCAQSAQSAAITNAIHGLRARRTTNQEPPTTDWSTFSIDPIHATTVADSISVDLPRDGLAAVRAVVESGGEAVAVDDREIVVAMPEIARLAGVFVEPSAATVWAGIKALARAGKLNPEERVVAFFTGNGLKDIARAREAAGEPTLIDPTPEAALAAAAHLGL